MSMLDARVVLAAIFSLRARIRPPSWPVRPTALPPAWLIRPTMSLLHLAAQHHLDHVHGLGVGDAHALDELALLAELGQRVSICGPPPCTTTGFMPTSFSSTTSSREAVLQRRLGHGVAAVLDDDRLAVEPADVRQRLRQDLGLVARRDVREIDRRMRRVGGNGGRRRGHTLILVTVRDRCVSAHGLFQGLCGSGRPGCSRRAPRAFCIPATPVCASCGYQAQLQS